MPIIIQHLASMSRDKRMHLLKKKAIWDTLSVDYIPMNETLDKIKEAVPKQKFILKSVGDVIATIESKGIYITPFNKAVELLPNMVTPFEADDAPLKPNINNSGSKIFINAMIHESGLMAVLDELMLASYVEDVLDVFKYKGPFSKLSDAIMVIHDVLKLAQETSGIDPTYTLLSDDLANLYDTSFDPLDKLLGYMGIDMPGILPKAVDVLAGPDIEHAIKLFKQSVVSELESFLRNYTLVDKAITNHSTAIKDLHTSTIVIGRYVKVLNHIDKTIVNWNNLHLSVVKSLDF